MMTKRDRAWIWATLQEMAALAAEQDEAEKEVKRLAEAYAAARARVVEAVPALSIEHAVDALRLIGSPLAVGEAAVHATPSSGGAPADVGDPLNIPPYLRRGETSARDGRAKLVHDADAVARSSAP